jgi:hypothetical protein
VEASGLNLDRVGVETVDGLESQGYFGRGAVVGLVTWDTSTYRHAVEYGYAKTLAAIGLRLKDVEYVSPPPSVADVGPTSSQIGAATLHLAAQGVNRVLILDGAAGAQAGGVLTLLFLADAESQHYRPTYGLNSNNGLSIIAGDVPKAQLHGALAVGWLPLVDEPASADPDGHANAARRSCLQVMAKHGIVFQNRNAELVGMADCDMMGLLGLVLGGLQDQQLSAASFTSALNRVGTSHQSPLTFQTSYSAHQHDGVAEVRHAAFVDGCACFLYTSPAYATR